MDNYDAELARRGRTRARWTSLPCLAGDKCRHRDVPILVRLDRGNVPLECSVQGLIFSPDGVRHNGCPDPYLAAWIAAREA